MRDSYYAPPVRDVIDSMLASESLTEQENARLFALSWELELLLLDEQSPERQWRQALTKPLRKLESMSREFTQTTDTASIFEHIDLRYLIRELAY